MFSGNRDICIVSQLKPICIQMLELKNIRDSKKVSKLSSAVRKLMMSYGVKRRRHIFIYLVCKDKKAKIATAFLLENVLFYELNVILLLFFRS
jgi:hypothetical protein